MVLELIRRQDLTFNVDEFVCHFNKIPFRVTPNALERRWNLVSRSRNHFSLLMEKPLTLKAHFAE